MTANGKEQNKPMIQKIFIPQEAEWISQQPISYLSSKDRLIRNPTKNGIFTVKSAYELMYMQKETFTNRVGGDNSDEREKHMWRRTWKLNVKRKIKHFIWKCCNRILPISDQLRNKRMQVDNICMVRPLRA